MSYLGKYLKMPPTIEKLHKLEKEIEKEGHSLSDLSLYLEFDFSPYENTMMSLHLLVQALTAYISDF
ncbi:hypothetical protein FC678_20760 [Peribacillus simplex]|uniref:Uncharacterized protein n=1 Tax=Peribacillus simplex TaxID=1478 RepID=A0A9X8ZDZ0_9BACI|nr:hypothetical protein [Peribacillus simplex]TKH08269.1 hypothetical protein FC678_20760 [Peribacillus simplex]